MSSNGHAGPGHHIAPVSLYITIFLLLMVMTLATWGVTFVHLGAFNLPVAMAIAITKATLVILFFMHVYWSPKIIKVTVGMSFFFLIIMLVMVMSDYLSRPQYGLPAFPNATATGTESVGNDHPAKLPEHGGEAPAHGEAAPAH
jgi:cytochrome c oxidase subunit 4